MTTNHNLIPKSIFDEDFNELNVGWSSASNINRLYNLDKGTVYVPKDDPSDSRFDKDVPVGSLMAERGPCSYEFKIAD